MTKRTEHGGTGMLDLSVDVRYGIRALRRTPGFTLVAFTTLALGIGAATAMFSVLDVALRRSLPYPEAERLVFGRTTFSGNVGPWSSFPDYMDYRDRSESLEALAAFGGGAGLLTLTGVGEPEQVRATTVTPNLFATLGVLPLLGGSFSIDEFPEAGGGEVVISYGFWQRWFGGSDDVVGRSLTVQGNPLTVVGVMPAGFRFMYDSDLWVPPWAGHSDPINRRFHNWLLLGRMLPGVSLDAAQSEVDVISAQLQQAYSDTNRNKALRLDALHAAIVERYRPSLFLLSGAIAFVLLIACGNVANLFLARGTTRKTELAVRAALGATRSRLTRQLLVECLILAVVAGSMGIVMAIWLQDLILGFVSMDLLGIEKVGLSSGMLCIALALSLGTVLLFGLFPSVAAARANPVEDLKKGSRGYKSGGGIRYRSGVVVFQVAMSLVLLVGSGLLIRSFTTLLAVDPGFRVENLLTARVSLPSDSYGDTSSRIEFFRNLRQGIEALPGVEMVSMIDMLPIIHPLGNYAIWAPERPPETNSDALWAERRLVLPGYFATMEIPLLEGRSFEESDVEGSQAVVILSRVTVERVFAGNSALGRQVAVDIGRDEPGLFEVVGVVEDHQISSLTGGRRPAMFFPFAQQPASAMCLTVVTATDPASHTRLIQERIWELDPDIVLSDAQAFDAAVASSVASTRAVTTVLTTFAAAAVALAALGLYGVLAFFVMQRDREIGIRVALGAPGASVLRLVITRGLALVGVGLALGTVGAFGATRLVEGMLFGISARDPATFAGVTGLFLLVALGACFVPAWKAVRVDPLEALREE